eukprot:CAMPEP_0183292172 /NCGR_PEP_ID=MMETSP0160_2-20130417/1331_1 /TAXON_ID=2839 ORGANISM="Odontella Sinensis, Strain Grunow 1884" /NCGR_SAMPLE_ID=MMETSP0160_2 /ASSEMBLY_ACC=CAM_ASM_000250 /LENGTH=319 /DNA_ID=CAMNT_0025453091 /DNA_START=19 /DNA_END=978 /DNA_ORIENTATION=-
MAVWTTVLPPRWCLLFCGFLAASLPLVGGQGLHIPKDGKYDENFFEQHRQSEGAYRGLVAVLRDLLRNSPPEWAPNLYKESVSVLDVGCGHGLFVEAWRQSGVSKSYCIEGSTEAKGMWPKKFQEEFYVVKDLTDDDAASKIVETDIVTSFEVAEHLPESKAGHFVSLLTKHNPEIIFFGAATVDQDQGQNPTHVNENTFAYWRKHFKQAGYSFDAERTARVRHLMITDDKFRPFVYDAWWYPKNILVFAPSAHQSYLDKDVASHPDKANMLSKTYLNAVGDDAFGGMWSRDWRQFGNLFYKEQKAARARLAKESKEEL